MKHRSLFQAVLLAVLGACPLATRADRPNIVFIMCDDLGYGDVHCLAPETGKIATPGADALAAAGMTFTDAHSGSSVCTPTRYGLLTGRYAWRSRLQKGVVTGFAPCLIDKDRPTVASFLKSQGYHTGIIGKWHLDFEYLDPQTGERYRQQEHKTPPVGARIPDGPLHRGFDYYHGFHHARNMEAVIENDRVIAHEDPVHMLPRLTRKAVEFITTRAGKDDPFFLYIPLGSPHTPIVPSPEWQGRSALGPYGDFVMQTDHVVVEVSRALEKHGLTGNTLVILTSDNGCSKAAGIEKLREQGHLVSAHLRGSKADIWDGGHRVPFIVRWPGGGVAPGSRSDELLCLTDFFATAADILDQDLPPGSCEDSVSFLPALRGQLIEAKRAGVIHHSISGHFAYRQGPWKLILASGSAGWTKPVRIPNGIPAQLYNLAEDPGETDNRYLSEPDVAQRLLAQLERDVKNGRSTPGPASRNDAPVVLWKERPEDNARRAPKKTPK